MSEPFRDEQAAALARVVSLEEENADLRAKLDARVAAPEESRNVPAWLLFSFVLVPVVMLGGGLLVALRFQHKPVNTNLPSP